ncbi:MAG: hypothetical protein NW205_01160 [Hyphomicrobiaceae bacterium]|nr:hypothetical protein [Hyphomicrobiaceae bacterium]
MSAEPLVEMRLTERALPERAAWAEGLTVRLPRSVAALAEHGAFSATDPQAGAAAGAAATALRERAAYIARAPRAARLPVSYRTVPGPMRRMIGGAIGRVQRLRERSWATFPGWPLDLSADLLADLADEPATRPGPTPVIVSHDIDSDEGLANLLADFLPREEARGARSANYIVPFAWDLDHGAIAEAAARGHEIGVHGYDHSSRTPFAPEAERAERLARGRSFGDRYGAAGYRAPSLMRTRALIEGLAPHYRYDSSIPTSGGPFPVPNNGCASARPWRIAGGMWELPLSLPRDGSLRFLGYSPEAIARLWLASADRIRRASGVVVLLTHCEHGFSGNAPMLAAYERFLDTIAGDDRYAFVLPRDLVTRLDGSGGVSA